MAPPVQYATTSDGMDIAYWATGSGASTLVYMPEPIITSGEAEFKLASPSRWYERLSRDRRVIRFDHRGTGLSTRDVPEFSLEALERDLVAVVEAAGGGPVDLWGQEDAGLLAMSFATHNADAVSRLVLSGTWSRTTDIPASPALQTLEKLMAEDWLMYLESIVHLVWRWHGDEANAYIAALQRTVPADSGRVFLESAWSWDVTALLPSLKCPALVLQRRDQPVFTLELAKKLAIGIANARLAVVDGDSQFPWVGDAEACVRAYEEFVGKPTRAEFRRAAPRGVSEVGYARSGEVNIAYSVTGDGPFDVVFVPGRTSHVEFVWDVPGIRAFFERVSSFSRLIYFDKRGTGLSDPVDAGMPLEVRMDDVRAVMDAAGSERAAVLGVSEGGPMSTLFAATYPERTWGLVLYGTYARELWAHDYPWGTPEADYRASLETMATGGRERFEELARSGSPNATEDEIAALARYLRLGGSLGAQIALARMNMGIDVRDVLPAIRVPTLVLHCAHDPWVSVEQGRFVARQIPSSTYVELDCTTHIAASTDVDMLIRPIRSFLERAWATGSDETAEPDRVLATVLFTDIAGSTEQAARLGDRAWREMLEQHHEVVRRQLLRFRGTEVDTAGDGFFASFDGPARAIRCARAITESVRDLGLDVRAGLHTGECELIDGKVAGIAVHTGARVASQAEAGEVLVSSTVKDLVAGSGIQFEDRGIAELKGIPGEWRLFAVAE